MTFLPIVERELRVASRNSKTYWQRIPFVIAAAFVCSSVVTTTHKLGFPRQAATTFFLLTQVSMYYGVFVGINETADCISRETREGTLGLLFLTDLKGYDIIFGKLSASAIKSFYALIAMLPVLAIVLLLGSVTARDFSLTVLALLNGIFFAHAIALLVSSLNRETQKAYSQTTLLLACFIWLLPALAFVPAEYGGKIFKLVAMVSPFYTLNHATRFSFTASFMPMKPVASSFWISFGLSQCFSWCCLMAASSIVRDCWRTKISRPWKERIRDRWRTWIHGSTEFRTRHRRQLLHINPFLWVISRDRFKKFHIWSSFVAVGLGFSGILALANRPGSSPDPQQNLFLCFIGVLSFGAMLKMFVGMEAARYIDKMKRSGELELLLSATPLSVQEIIEGQWAFLKRLFLRPMLFVITCNMLVLLLGSGYASEHFFRLQGIPARLAFILSMTTLIVMVMMDSWAIGWFGMWMGISSRTATQSTNSAIAPVLFLPWLIFGLVALGLASICDRLHLGEPNFFILLVLWIAICVTSNLFWARYASRRLFEEFRTLALTYADERLTFWGRVGRFFGKMWKKLRS